MSIMAAIVITAFLGAEPVSISADAYRAQIEADWLLQEKYRDSATTLQITPSLDAAGGCDGVKDGKWGFHTDCRENPWWQVDLGAAFAIQRVVIWNRCDAADRTNHLSLLLSDDGQNWQSVYTHDGTTFYGFTDNKPLSVPLDGKPGRFVRVQLPGNAYLHLDEVEVFGVENADKNLALGHPADQSGISQWSVAKVSEGEPDWARRIALIADRCKLIAADLESDGVNCNAERAAAETLSGAEANQSTYMRLRWIERRLLLADPRLNFDAMLFTKRVPGSFNHMSDQYYGWWSRPGGGIFVLSGFKGESPSFASLTDSFAEAGSFLRPALSFDASKILFAWCRHYPDLAAQPDKLNKANVPEDAFYHVFEMNADGSDLRQLTHGKYDDFDARYLPDGRIVFLSTRRGQFVQCGKDTAALSVEKPDLPDCYVRCGGGPERPVAVYTLHTMNADGGNLCSISPFEMFEWTPSISNDGTILYSRWDYIDRWNMPYMSLWSIHPDGTNPRLVFKNFTLAPHCTFEPQCVPGSRKVVFTASGHHAQTMGSLVLLDTTVGTEGAAPMKRLTPETCFPEIEGWPRASYTSPWPLSEKLYLVAWGPETTPVQGSMMAQNGMGLYLFHASGAMTLLYRDPEISSWFPLPIQPRKRPPVVPDTRKPTESKEGWFAITNVYHGLNTVQPSDIKTLRIVAVPAKTHPTMNYPIMGLTADDPGKCVLGTVPVEEDGSAYFSVPAGVTVFFQALDARGIAVQTMRGATHVQPGQTLSCGGCHEKRTEAPLPKPVLAMHRAPSKITVGPEGSWPLRFDRLVQPVLDARCVQCHNPASGKPGADKFDLTSANAYAALCNYGKPSLADTIKETYRQGYSKEGHGAAATNPVLAKLTASEGHHDIALDQDSQERLLTWLDTYGQRLGSFSEDQEKQLQQLRADSAAILIERVLVLSKNAQE